MLFRPSFPSVLILLTACAVPVTEPSVGRHAVRIEGAEGRELHLTRVGGTERRVPGPDLLLFPGRYILTCRRGDRVQYLPIPLPPGVDIPDPLVVTITAPPADDPDWAWIPPGPALRGDRLGVGQEDERPAAVLDTDGFWLARRETTNRQYVRFLNSTDSVDATWLDLAGHKCRIQRAASGAFATDAPDLPVVTVSWAGAVAYCTWLTRTDGRTHRLPTETEWEKAARGPGTSVYAYGDVFTVAAANQESGILREVGTFDPSPWGLHDLTGNAFEWMADAYARDAYRGGAPAPDSTYRVLRGGSFVLDGIYQRNAMRMFLRPEVRADDVGFRVLRQPGGSR